MTCIQIMGSAALSLLVANSLVWAAMPESPLFSPFSSAKQALGGGCVGSGSPTPSKEILAKTVLSNTFQPTVGNEENRQLLAPLIECDGCSVMINTYQYWCKMRPPGTECWGGPAWGTFEVRRVYKEYNCPGNKTAICCGEWTDDGCCNSSGDEPICVPSTGYYKCQETPNCP